MRIFTVLLCVVVFLCPVITVSAANEPSVSAAGAVLMCADSGEFLYERNADKSFPMASTTKIMTAVVALDCRNCDRIVEVGNEILSAEGTMLGLAVGDKIRLNELVLAMMLSSGNDAANAVAVAVGGSIEEFAILMNAYALELGMSNTNFVTPSGLDAQGHYTSARDLSVLTKYALGIPGFVEICSAASAEISLNDGMKTLKVYNHNKLLSKYDGAIGVKTGFTKKSGRCLVSAAEKGGITLIAVTLNDGDDWNDHIRLLDFGFDTVLTNTAFMGTEKYYVPVAGAGLESIECVAASPVIVCSITDYSEIVERVSIEHFVYAPVSPGEIVGCVEYLLDGKIIQKVPICAVSSENCAAKVSADSDGGSTISVLINKIIGWFTDGRK